MPFSQLASRLPDFTYSYSQLWVEIFIFLGNFNCLTFIYEKSQQCSKIVNVLKIVIYIKYIHATREMMSVPLQSAGSDFTPVGWVQRVSSVPTGSSSRASTHSNCDSSKSVVSQISGSWRTSLLSVATVRQKWAWLYCSHTSLADTAWFRAD